MLSMYKRPPPAQGQAGVPAAELGQPQSESNVEAKAEKSTILDWSGRTFGQEPRPDWLKPLVINGNAEAARLAFGLPSNPQVKAVPSQRANREEARVLSELMFSRQAAVELRQYVRAAGADNMDEGQLAIVAETTAVAEVTITGTQRVADFWQLVETENPGTKLKMLTG
jgi:hypothetical protein